MGLRFSTGARRGAFHPHGAWSRVWDGGCIRGFFRKRNPRVPPESAAFGTLRVAYNATARTPCKRKTARCPPSSSAQAAACRCLGLQSPAGRHGDRLDL